MFWNLNFFYLEGINLLSTNLHAIEIFNQPTTNKNLVILFYIGAGIEGGMQILSSPSPSGWVVINPIPSLVSKKKLALPWITPMYIFGLTLLTSWPWMTLHCTLQWVHWKLRMLLGNSPDTNDVDLFILFLSDTGIVRTKVKHDTSFWSNRQILTLSWTVTSSVTPRSIKLDFSHFLRSIERCLNFINRPSIFQDVSGEGISPVSFVMEMPQPIAS